MADLIANLQAAAGSAGGGGWDISTAVYDPGNAAWDISKAIDTGISFSVATQETSPQGVFFKPDGTKMYVIGSTGDDVNEYTLSSPWVVSTASYVQIFSVSTQEGFPTGIFFKPDGTKMYIIGSGSDAVHEYSLSTAWNISTASFVQTFSVQTQDTSPQSLFFKPDGTKMYVLGDTGDDVNEYSLSSAWDISTASYVQNFSVSAQETTPSGLSFKPDGTKMYVVGSNSDNLYEYSLSSAWDISTASYSQLLDISPPATTPTGIFFKEDGSLFYLVASDTDVVYQFVFGGFDVLAQESSPQGLFFKPDGTKMYVLGATGDDVNEYTLSTAWNIDTASYVQNFSIATQEITPTGLFFKPDGTKMYVVGTTGDDVNEYNLSSAWNISTASYVQVFSVATEETLPQGVFFKPDGTKMYIAGDTGNDINEYSLSTAWNVSTASYVRNFGISGQDATVRGVFFKFDGTKMYAVGDENDGVYEYNLSTPWNISTATYLQTLKLVAGVTPTDLYIKDDGTQLFIMSDTPNRVSAYTLS